MHITSDDRMPNRQTISDWFVRPPKGGERFPGDFARARELGIDSLVDEALHLARDGSRDYIVDEEGKPRVDHEHIARTKLICEQIRWTASKIYRRQYGDDGLFAQLAAGVGVGAKVSVTIETVGAPAVEPPTYTAEPE